MFKIVHIPKVSACKASDCAYNLDQACHAIAITVGDGARAACDTFFKTDTRRTVKGTAGVGACKVSNCRHNLDFECGATDIRVGVVEEAVSCVTFEPR